MSDTQIYREIFAQVEKLPVIDTHEHLPCVDKIEINDHAERDSHARSNGHLEGNSRTESKRQLEASDTAVASDKAADVLQEYLSHYMGSDLVSAGLSLHDLQKATDSRLDILERWKIVEPYWEVSRYTGYGRGLDLSVKAIYGIDGINAQTIRDLNESFSKSKTPEHQRQVLQDLCGIRVSLVDVQASRTAADSPQFRRVWQPQNFINPVWRMGREWIPYIEDLHAIKVRTLDDWLEALERELAYILATYQVNVLKIGSAYFRSLRFEKVDYSLAKESFASAFSKWEETGRGRGEEIRLPGEVQDYVMHHILGIANKKRLTLQFHTGLQHGNGNTLTNSDPSLLINLFLRYRNVRFDLFHISYPYQNVACALSKNFPNVYIDMCWAHLISPSASVQALEQFLDTLPYNKISAFGGDYLFLDGVYGHLQLARENVSQVLASKVEQGLFSLDKAIEVARALFYDNPRRILQLHDLPE